LTPKEAAELVGCSESLIYQLCDERRLLHYRVGGKGRRGKILIAEADLDAFLATCRVTPAQDVEFVHLHVPARPPA
jgi:excisionase family DNA binding protein